jgi:hypothetical protein
MRVPGTRIMLGLMLMAGAGGANAECVLSVPASYAGSSCIRDLSPQSVDTKRPNAKVTMSNDTRPADIRLEVARSMSDLPWAESRDWIHHPPEWLRDIKDNRRRGAPVPLLHLWRSQQTQTLVALGVNHRGQPGLYMSRKLPY